MTRLLRGGAACAFGLALAGCMSTGPSGGSAPANPPPAAAAEATPAPAQVDPSMLGGVLAGSVGLGLEDSDRRAAYGAQTAALDSGQRKSWKGARGAFGYVEVGPAQGACRPFSQTVYVAGRPYNGHGTGCKQADGSWRMGAG